jgi:hypothetical protein
VALAVATTRAERLHGAADGATVAGPGGRLCNVGQICRLGPHVDCCIGAVQVARSARIAYAYCNAVGVLCARSVVARSQDRADTAVAVVRDNSETRAVLAAASGSKERERRGKAKHESEGTRHAVKRRRQRAWCVRVFLRGNRDPDCAGPCQPLIGESASPEASALEDHPRRFINTARTSECLVCDIHIHAARFRGGL